ncbi:anti-sigma factor family protein [Pararhizobium haloflavum]|uniref:anti-sigma factor family protein n=1 Tax=Pararhizobium haloflavum TaxID=2037914 RepID=UPI000C19A27C|nr:anti-sigma factor [Pararhizobium haloflavum]
MNRHPIDDETLMAFADGELDEATAKKVEEAINADETVAERVALFAESRALARDALEPRLDAPVPASLLAAVEAAIARAKSEDTAAREADIIAFRQRKPAVPPAANENRPAFSRLALAAACVAMIASGVVGYIAGGGTQSASPSRIALIDAPGVDEALSNVASGGEMELTAGGAFRAISSFRDETDRFCREFELAGDGSGYVAVACREAGDWSLAFAVDAPIAEGGYAPASSLETLDSYLTSIGAGQPLSAEDEAAALAE